MTVECTAVFALVFERSQLLHPRVPPYYIEQLHVTARNSPNFVHFLMDSSAQRIEGERER